MRVIYLLTRRAVGRCRQAFRAQDTSAAHVIIHRSVQANNADWKAQTDYSFRRSDVGGSLRQTFEVTMLKGSPYERLLALNDKPIGRRIAAPGAGETGTRNPRPPNETLRQRHARIAKYEDNRADENFLMRQMVSAFTFHLIGQEQMDGVDCYVLKATPNPAYRPPVEKARALTGMQGRMWIDRAHYHWVKFKAQVTKPVAFGLIHRPRQTRDALRTGANAGRATSGFPRNLFRP